ncbi:MAG: ATP-grasp domain-containing protein [Nitrospinae bacterium]|nr:ATP-grasp domain-containing protein [Nitrospinota bacterium]
MRVGLTYNLKKGIKDGLQNDWNAEWDTEETIDAVRSALSTQHDVVPLEADENIVENLKGSKPDIVFNIAEGRDGPNRESHVPAMLEMLGIPYTGSDPLTLSLCLDKGRAKEILSFYKVSTPRFQVVSSISERIKLKKFPLIVKPLHEGSSKGVKNDALVFSPSELKKKVEEIIAQYRQSALIEEYLNGREFTVALMGNNGDTKVLPIVEIKFDNLPKDINPIYSYEAKWIWDNSKNPLDIFQCPADIDDELRDNIEETALKAYKSLRCRDLCRIDIRLDSDNEPNILELNPLPGVLPNPEDNSCFPKAARTAGMSYNEMILSILNIARKRYKL